MKPNRNELRLEVAATREKLIRAQDEHKQNITTLERRLVEERDALSLVESQLKILNLCVQAYLPDGEPPLAGGPVEPIRRGARSSNFRELILSLVKKYPGNPADTLAQKVGQSSSRTLTALAYWETKGEVRHDQPDAWWSTACKSTEEVRAWLERSGNLGDDELNSNNARDGMMALLERGEAEEIDGRYRPIVKEEA